MVVYNIYGKNLITSSAGVGRIKLREWSKVHVIYKTYKTPEKLQPKQTIQIVNQHFSIDVLIWTTGWEVSRYSTNNTYCSIMAGTGKRTGYKDHVIL